jgi:hypothetical protein
MKQSPEQSSPVVLSVSVISDGVFYGAGSETPFTETTLPPHLREYIASGQEDFYTPAERDIYRQRPELGEPPTVFRFLDGQGRGIQRQAAQVASGLQEQAYLEMEAQAANKLSPELEEVLQSEHDRHIGLVKAQAEFNRNLTDSIYAEAEWVAEPQKFFVRRGAVYVDVRKTTPKPAEHVFTNDEGGDWRMVGLVDSEGRLPEPPIIP